MQRLKVTYEWTVEELDGEEIIASDFADKLSNFNKADTRGKDIGLVRTEGCDADGVTDRVWAYVTNNKLPKFFTDVYGHAIGYKVPKRFHVELDNWNNRQGELL